MDAAGITPRHLSTHLDVAPKRVYDWLRGGGKPNDDNARRIAELLGISETETRFHLGLYVQPDAMALYDTVAAARRVVALKRQAAKSKREREAFDDIIRALDRGNNPDFGTKVP